MDDLSRLATHMKPDKDYRLQHAPGIGYVCPRADGYGGREGVIPPGVAAKRGLIPKGMREVSNDTVARRAKEASAAGRPDAERYAEYYGRGAKENAPKRPVTAPPPAPVQPPVVRPAVPAKPTRVVTRPTPKSTKTPVKSAAPKAPRVFPDTENLADGDDTLDGFYDSLHGIGYGTGESERNPRKRPAKGVRSPVGKRGASLPDPQLHLVRGAEPEVDPEDSENAAEDPDSAGGFFPVEPDAGSATTSDPNYKQLNPEAQDGQVAELVDRIAAERDDAIKAYDELQREYLVLQDQLNRKPKTPPPEVHDTVRVQLSAEPEKMKVGGRDVLGDVWEVRLMGHLDFSRDRTEAVLTIIDSASGSEVLNQISPGEFIVLTKAGRTTCVYSGICDKIYGDPGSSAFITCIRLKVTGETE